MTAQSSPERPETTMGLALAARVLQQIQPRRPAPASEDIIDLTTPEVAATPAHVRDMAKTALDEGQTHYTEGAGIEQLREAIARHLGGLGYPVQPESVGVTNGGTEAIYIALQVALSPGETALAVEPVSGHIIDMIRFIGAQPERVEVDPARDFIPDVEAIRKPDAKLLVVASPSPVTGKRIPDDNLEALIRSAREREMAVILDLSYAAGLYEPEPVRFKDQSVLDEVILAGSFSTAHGLAGWRIGFFSAPPGNRTLFGALKNSMSICTPAVSQFAAVAALGDPREWFEERRAHFAANRDLATGLLDDAGFGYVRPDAFPPLLVDVSKLGGGHAVAQRLAEQGVIVDAGSAFGASTAGFIRINLGAARETLASGIERVVSL